MIPTDFASRILISKGLTKMESIPIRDLYKVKTPLQLESLISSLEIEEENEILEPSDEINIQLTNICRRQLIDPIISIVKSQANSSERTKIVKSFGNLLYPGTYPYSKNMDLGELIYASGGFKDADYLPQIEINSREMRNKEYIISSRNMVFSNNQNTKELIGPMDEINVKEVSNKFRTVEISGEVNYPGFYPMIEGESLNDLIRRAGGIKESGSYEGAIFTRESLRKSDRKRLKDAQTDLRRKILLSISQMQATQESGSNNLGGVSELVKLLTFEQEDNELLGRLVIDLESMLMGKSPEIYLEDKDKIFIPRKHQMVTVVGEVNGSNSHQYKQNLGASDYISLSGGFSSFGDTNNVYIVKSDGSTYSYSTVKGGFFRDSSQIQAGDTIVIPFQAEKFEQLRLRAAGEITTIFYQMAIAAAAVNSFGRNSN
jgi:protein involved in polysaccharide export with SLBB domain